MLNIHYRNYTKVLDREVWANSVDLEEPSDQGLHCLQFSLHLLYALHYVKAILLKV